MLIYKTTNLINNKIYIGKRQKSTNDFLNEDYYGSGLYIKRAIKKYGKENFKKEIVEDNINDKKLLCEREKYWIKTFNSRDLNVGYNVSKGGDGFSEKRTQENRKNISLGAKKRFKNIIERKKASLRSKKRFEDIKEREKISIATKIAMKSPEIRKKISNKLLGRKVVWGKKISQTRIDKQLSAGKNNPMYEKSIKDVWIEKCGLEKAEKMWEERYNKKHKCVYCNMEYSKNMLNRWHNENCKFKK
ncbi:MAG: hypothetical protein JETCAE03_34390 [Ignavibacteriaceae bacterium]|nr:MAG: hypothetical protein JETCAE03_34390 [Ignavibacteriaceae bacterium]